MSSETAVGLACAVGVVLLYSSFVLVSRYGLHTELEPTDLAFLRYLVAGLILLPVFLRHGTAGLTLAQCCVLAGVGGLSFALLVFYGFKLAPASHGSALLHGTLPAFSFVAGYFSGGVLPDRLSLAGILATAGGVLLMIWDSLSVASGSQMLGDILLLCGSLNWAVYGVLVRRFRVAAFPATAILACFAMIVYVPLYLAATSDRILHLPITDVITQAIFQGVFIAFLSIVLYTRTVQALGPDGAALAAALVPGLTTVLAIPMLGEWPSMSTMTGVLLVTLGIIVPLALRRRNL